MALRRVDERTTVGVAPHVRDDLAAYRDKRGLPNYNEALKTLLNDEGDE